MFLARPITTGSCRSAFAVLQMTGVDTDLIQFRRRVASGRLDGPRGLVAGVFDRRDYIHALFSAMTDRDLRSRLRVTEFRHSDQIAAAFMVEMIESVEDWAKTLGCDQITIEAAHADCSSGRPLADVLVSLGFSGESTVLARRL